MTSSQDGLGGLARVTHETAITASAERERAAVQARYVVAIQRPRNVDDFRTALLKRCESSVFAAIARYSVPRAGKSITGPSIVFVREAMRLFGNADLADETIYDDHEKRLIRCQAIDFETNFSRSAVITIDKTVERKHLKPGEKPISSRVNSVGELVYKMPATDDDVFMKSNAMISKTLRNLGLTVLPSDHVDEAQRHIIETVRAGVANDPDSERKALVDGFADVGVSAAQLAEYMGGRTLDALSPAELVELRGLYVALKGGELRWPEAFDASPFRASQGPAASPVDDPNAKRRQEAREKIAKASEKLKGKGQAAPPAAPSPKPEVKPEPAKPEPTPPPAEEKKPKPGVDEPPADWKPSE